MNRRAPWLFFFALLAAHLGLALWPRSGLLGGWPEELLWRLAWIAAALIWLLAFVWRIDAAHAEKRR